MADKRFYITSATVFRVKAKSLNEAKFIVASSARASDFRASLKNAGAKYFRRTGKKHQINLD